MSKPTIFLVHGYNGIPKIYSYFKETFEKNDYRVVMPSFPTQTDITIDRYFDVFDQYKNDLNDNTIIIGHSIGNIMSLKYLYKNNITIRGYISLAGFGEPFMNEGRDDLNNVIAPLCLTNEELAKVPKLIGKAYSIYSDDDHIVPFDILKKYPTIIGAEDRFIPGIGHMGKKEWPRRIAGSYRYSKRDIKRSSRGRYLRRRASASILILYQISAEISII